MTWGGYGGSISSAMAGNGREFDSVIIGGGSAGYAAARSCAAAGLNTAVIEGGEEVGGLCILRGCMPTKALLYASEVLHLASHAGAFGIRTETSFDYGAIMARKDRLIKEFADYRKSQLEDGRFTFIRAHARFKDAHTLELSNGEEVRARNFVIATGSVTAPSPLKKLDEIGYITSDEALTLKKIPKSLIVLGGGAVAVEFAQFSLKLFNDIVLGNPQYADLILGDIYTHHTYYMGLVDENNRSNFYDGQVRVVHPNGKEFVKYEPKNYAQHIAEHVEPRPSQIQFPDRRQSHRSGWRIHNQ